MQNHGALDNKTLQIATPSFGNARLRIACARLITAGSQPLGKSMFVRQSENKHERGQGTDAFDLRQPLGLGIVMAAQSLDSTSYSRIGSLSPAIALSKGRKCFAQDPGLGAGCPHWINTHRPAKP